MLVDNMTHYKVLQTMMKMHEQPQKNGSQASTTYLGTSP